MSARRVLLACAVALLVTLSEPGVATAIVPVQDDETTTSVAEDSSGSGEDNPLLVPGPAAEEPTPADAVATDEDAPPATDSAQDDAVDGSVDAGSTNDEAEDTVRLVMMALIGVAVALAALTVYYWWRTRPSRRAEPRRRRGSGDDDGDADVDDPVSASAETANSGAAVSEKADSAPDSDDTGTVGGWQTDSTSTR